MSHADLPNTPVDLAGAMAIDRRLKGHSSQTSSLLPSKYRPRSNTRGRKANRTTGEKAVVTESQTLEERLAKLGGELLEREVARYLAGKLVRRPQDVKRVTLAPKLDPAAGELDFARPAEELVRRVRAYTPDPGAFVTLRGQRIGVLRASIAGGSPAG